MANSHGSNADVVGNGYVLSTYLNSVTMSGSKDAGDASTFKVSSKQYVPGLKDSSFSCEGLFEGDIDKADQVLFAALSTEVSGLFSYYPMGQEVVGRPVYSMDTISSSYEITTEVADIASISAEMQGGDKGVFNRGKVSRPMSIAAAAGNTGVIDNGAASTAGAALVVHATAAASLVVKLQDSLDGTTFADLAGTISVPTGRSSQRLIIPGNIRRYTRVLWTGTGTFTAVTERN